MSTFFATLSEISPDPEHPEHRPHAVPVPGDVSAAFYSLAEAFEAIRRDFARGNEESGQDGENSDDLLTQMIQNLLGSADTPPREVEGVSEEFCDRKTLSASTMSVAFRGCKGHKTMTLYLSRREQPYLKAKSNELRLTFYSS